MYLTIDQKILYFPPVIGVMCLLLTIILPLLISFNYVLLIPLFSSVYFFFGYSTLATFPPLIE